MNKIMCATCPKNRQHPATRIENGTPVCDSCFHNPESERVSAASALARRQERKEKLAQREKMTYHPAANPSLFAKIHEAANKEEK